MVKLQAYCDRVIFWPQYGPTCWFNALLIAVFYSQHSRNMLYKKSAEWDKSIEFYRILRFVLKHKYLKSKNPEKDFKFFDVMRPENILSMIHKLNPKYVTENMGTHGAWSSDVITKIYKLLQVECLMLEIYNDKIYYSNHNHMTFYKQTPLSKYQAIEKIKSPEYIKNKLNRLKHPSVLIINLENNQRNSGTFYYRNKHYEIPTTEQNKNILKLNDVISYNGEEYILDSVITTNWNNGHRNMIMKGEIIKGHQIAGITCDNKRYVYNGWTRWTVDPAMKNANGNGNGGWRPCEFMKFNWDTKKDIDFCLNRVQCNLPKATKKDKESKLCFSFGKGIRSLIYIKKVHVSRDAYGAMADIPDYQSFGNYKSTTYKPCPINNIRNPVTSRCINEETAVKKNLIKPKKPERKECPPGKVRNPATGRCIKDPKLNKKPVHNDKNSILSKKKPDQKKTKKECPPGKVRNPSTGRCIKDPKLNKKPVKKICPEGKILNKLTGRCIKSPYQKALELHAKKVSQNLAKQNLAKQNLAKQNLAKHKPV
jgi:hypothetical protein